MGIFKLTLFHSSKKLQSENKQNKMEVEIGLTAGLEAWGFDTYQKNLLTRRRIPGVRRSEVKEMSEPRLC